MTTATAVEIVVDFQSCWAELDLPAAVREVLAAAPLVQAPETRSQLLDWAGDRAIRTGDWATATTMGSTKWCSRRRA